MKQLVILGILSAFAMLGGAVVGCQTYDFQVVSQGTLSQAQEEYALTPPLKPNLWLLVDRSGSMGSPDACSGGGACQTTRIQALQSAMLTFLKSASSVARMGLSFFPAESGGCDPANTVDVPLPAPTPDDVDHDQVLKDTADLIGTKITTITPKGGTPTAASIAFVGSQPGLTSANDGRDDYILLLTDGLPNCNSANPTSTCGCASGPNNTPRYTCTTEQEARCRCTNGPGKCGTLSTCSQCLDQDNTAAQIAALKRSGIRTIVLAFAPTLSSGDAAETLEAMAIAGGANFRTCDSASDCGPDDTCTVPSPGAQGLCHRQYFRATSSTELEQVLDAIIAKLPPEPCTFTLSQGRPDSAKTIAVLVNDTDVRPGPDSWTYSGNSIVFAPTSTYCADIKAKKPGMTLVVRYVSTL